MSANLLSVNFFGSSESETIELKEVVVDEIKKEIIAFANCDGGKLYIGVQDDGQKASMSGRVILRFLLRIRQSAV